ncbi:MAG: nodulation protein NfeD [Acidobacteriaceae bacterium]
MRGDGRIERASAKQPSRRLGWVRFGLATAAAALAVLVCGTAPSQAAPPPSHAESAPSRPVVVNLPLHDTIQPISAAYLQRGLRHAARIHAEAVVVELGTPGGLLTSTRVMVTAIEQSAVPVIVYVAPSGSRAGSAGFFILEAADVAAMSPGTEAGASHPILEGQKMGPILKEKIENDAAAFLRSYVSRRGRNVQAAEGAVRNSKSYSDQESLHLHLIDLIAPDTATLLDHLNGTTITRFNGTKQVLRTQDADVQTLLPSTRERILGALTDPNLAVILLILGGLLIYLEFNAPGTIVPGALGTVLVLISLFALNLLPLEHAAIGFLVGALVLFVLDIKFTTHGILGLAAIGCLVFGALVKDVIGAELDRARVVDQDSDWTLIVAELGEKAIEPDGLLGG